MVKNRYDKYKTFSKTEINAEFLKICDDQNPDMDLLKYLLTSTELAQNADIHYVNKDDNNGTLAALERGNINIVKYLLSSPELSSHDDIHNSRDYIFFCALIDVNKDLLHFLIVDMQIDKTEYIEKYLEEYKNQYGTDYAEKLFLMRNLDENLTLDKKVIKSKISKL